MPETPAPKKLERNPAQKKDNLDKSPKPATKKIKVKPITNNDNQTKEDIAPAPATKKKVVIEVLEAYIIGRSQISHFNT